MFDATTRPRRPDHTVMSRCSVAGAAIVLTLLAVPWDRAARARDTGDSDARVTADPAGALASVSADSFDTGRTDGFFANLGTNGRSCGTCHVAEDAWTLTPGHARSLASDDPLFMPNDGSDCPPADAAQGPDSTLSSELLDYGLIRVQLPIPATADFSLVTTPPEESYGSNGRRAEAQR